MQVFHGSDVRIEKIDLAKSEFFKDFGRGFYVTTIREHAYLRAIDVCKRHNASKPIVTEFKYIETYPDTVGMNIKKFKSVCKEWVEFIMLNRNRQISHPAHTFDIVEGPIADDKMVIQIRLYEQGKISIEKLVEKLTYKEQTHQICFCTIAALYALELVDENKFNSAIDDITKGILETMVVDFKMAESVAIKTFYSSELYEKLSNSSNMLWQKPWLDVYNMLKEELSD
jgi:DNA-directed RNA polymerase subunit K/omega